MYERMYSEAVKKGADIVICDYSLESEDGNTIKYQEIPKSKTELFHNIAINKIHCSLCNKLINISLAKRYRIEPGVNMWEDLSITTLMLLDAETVIKIEAPYYHYYLDNTHSVSKGSLKRSSQSTINAMRFVMEQIEKSGKVKDLDKKDLYLLQWRAKRDLLYYPTKENMRLWHQIFPEVNKLYTKLELSKKSKILTFLATHNLTAFIRLYNRYLKWKVYK